MLGDRVPGTGIPWGFAYDGLAGDDLRVRRPWTA